MPVSSSVLDLASRPLLRPVWTSTSESRDSDTISERYPRPHAHPERPRIEGRLKFDTGPDVEILFGRAVLVKVVGDGVRFIIRVGDAADVAKTTGPARAVAVPI